MKKAVFAAIAASLAMPAVASLELAQKNACTACHAVDKKLVGPSYKDVAAKYKGNAKAEAMLAEKVKKGGQGVWGPIPMPPQTLPDADAKTLAAWLAAGAKK